MKNILKLSIVCLVMLAVNVSCSKPEPDSEMIKMQVPVLQDDGEYKLTVVEVPRPKSMETLESDFVNFKYYVSSNDIKYSAYDGKFLIDGESPNFEFVKKGDVYIPAGQIESLEAATMYYLMYTLKEKMDDLNWTFENYWPRRIVLHSVPSKNNAFYSSAGDFFGMVVYEDQYIPATMNADVWYHEAFHSIYYHAYANKLFKEKNGYNPLTKMFFSEGNKAMARMGAVRTYNEGFSDLFAFLMTGSSEIMNHFARGHSSYRNFSEKPKSYAPFSDTNYVKDDHFYVMGSYFAKSFLAIQMEKLGLEYSEHGRLSKEVRDSILQEALRFITNEVFTDIYMADNSTVEASISVLNKYRMKVLGKETEEVYFYSVDPEAMKNAKPDEILEEFTDPKKPSEDLGVKNEE
ncbi:MAG: hypothetical protein VX642_04160 [Bdellovibrionota bacterium]|nr:hypothetical protein [Bdellovibrionota bacterium]